MPAVDGGQWKRVQAWEMFLGGTGVSDADMAMVRTPVKPPWFAFGLRENEQPNWSVDIYETTLDGKVVRTIAGGSKGLRWRC